MSSVPPDGEMQQTSQGWRLAADLGVMRALSMNPMAVRLLALVSALVSSGCVGLFCIACDGHLGVEGYVYRALPSEPSNVTIDAETASQHTREALAECAVTLEPWGTGKQPRSADTARLWTKQTVTDSSGHFMAGGTAAPGHYDVTISVTCPTGGTVQRVFRHDRQQTHEVTVLLASGS